MKVINITKIKHGWLLLEVISHPATVVFDGMAVAVKKKQGCEKSILRNIVLQGDLLDNDNFNIKSGWVIDHMHPQSYMDWDIYDFLRRDDIIEDGTMVRKICHPLGVLTPDGIEGSNLSKLETWNFDSCFTANWNPVMRSHRKGTHYCRPSRRWLRDVGDKYLSAKIFAHMWVRSTTGCFNSKFRSTNKFEELCAIRFSKLSKLVDVVAWPLITLGNWVEYVWWKVKCQISTT